MIASERRRYILEALSAKGVISLKDTAKQLGVAEITARRDFEKLEGEGKLKRVQGGAAFLDDPDGAELTMSGKLPKNMREKEAVALIAASLVSDGDSVFIDGGTTMLPLAMLLVKKDIRIVTHNMLIFEKIRKATARIILIGGEYFPHYSMNLGPIAQEMLKQFYFDKAFFGCSGVDVAQKMVYTTEPESMHMKRIAMQNSKQNHLLIDSSKFEKRGFLKLSDTDDFTSIFTDKYEGTDEALENLIVATRV